MATLHIEHPITDLPTWTAAFGALADMRRKIGVATESVRHPVGDDRYIVIDLEFGDVDAARSFLEFLETQVWPKPEASPALAGTPEARIFETVDLPPAPEGAERTTSTPPSGLGTDGDATPGAWLTVVDWPGGTLETFDRLESSHDDHDHLGLLARYCSQHPDALRIVAVWESEEAADRFFADLPTANREQLAPGGRPTASAFAAERVYDARTDPHAGAASPAAPSDIS